MSPSIVCRTRQGYSEHSHKYLIVVSSIDAESSIIGRKKNYGYPIGAREMTICRHALPEPIRAELCIFCFYYVVFFFLSAFAVSASIDVQDPKGLIKKDSSVTVFRNIEIDYRRK